MGAELIIAIIVATVAVGNMGKNAALDAKMIANGMQPPRVSFTKEMFDYLKSRPPRPKQPKPPFWQRGPVRIYLSKLAADAVAERVERHKRNKEEREAWRMNNGPSGFRLFWRNRKNNLMDRVDARFRDWDARLQARVRKPEEVDGASGRQVKRDEEKRHREEVRQRYSPQTGDKPAGNGAPPGYNGFRSVAFTHDTSKSDDWPTASVSVIHTDRCAVGYRPDGTRCSHDRFGFKCAGCGTVEDMFHTREAAEQAAEQHRKYGPWWDSGHSESKAAITFLERGDDGAWREVGSKQTEATPEPSKEDASAPSGEENNTNTNGNESEDNPPMATTVNTGILNTSGFVTGRQTVTHIGPDGRTVVDDNGVKRSLSFGRNGSNGNGSAPGTDFGAAVAGASGTAVVSGSLPTGEVSTRAGAQAFCSGMATACSTGAAGLENVNAAIEATIKGLLAMIDEAKSRIELAQTSMAAGEVGQDRIAALAKAQDDLQTAYAVLQEALAMAPHLAKAMEALINASGTFHSVASEFAADVVVTDANRARAWQAGSKEFSAE